MKNTLIMSLIAVLSVLFASHGQTFANRDEKLCVEFTHPYCSQLNYTHAIFPNPRGHESPEEAAIEFADFTRLLETNCHPKLGTLLCFFYFPYCNDVFFELNDEEFYPCKEVCEEVHNSTCTSHVTSAVKSWVQHLQCNYTNNRTGEEYYKKSDSEDKCINGVAPYYDLDFDECAAGTHWCDSNAVCTNTKGSYNCTCNAGYTGDGRVCTECPRDECNQCDYRNNANSKIFQRNCYCYAAHVRVLKSAVVGCSHTYSVTVLEQFDVQTPYNSTHTSRAPLLAVNKNVTVVVNPSRCDACSDSLKVGNDYIIAGSYEESSDGVTWKLGEKSLISPWVAKYDKRMAKWVESGNQDRISKSNCLQQCDK